MPNYTKLFNSIVTSTIWTEDDKTRILWITMLAMADQHGEVHASIPGLARIAGIPIADAEAAIEKFLSPDPYSRTPDEEGRRIAVIDGGWELLNHKKYRVMASAADAKEKNAERQQRSRNRNKNKSKNVTDSNGRVTHRNASVTLSTDIAEAEAEAEANSLEHESEKRSSKVQRENPFSLSHSSKSPKPKSDLQLKVEKLMNRRQSTPMSEPEQKAWKRALGCIEATTADDWEALEKFYAAPQSETFARKDLQALLNNWNGEVDKARVWIQKSAPKAPTHKGWNEVIECRILNQ